jgi:hypothetical protein
MHAGPLVAGGWQLGRKQLAGLDLLGQPYPEPAWGHFLIDTGAAIVAIDEGVARQLKLKPTGQREKVHGFGMAGETPTYEATLLLHLESAVHTTGLYGFNGEVHAITRLRERNAECDYKTADGQPADVIGVIGRRFLSTATII